MTSFLSTFIPLRRAALVSWVTFIRRLNLTFITDLLSKG